MPAAISTTRDNRGRRLADGFKIAVVVVVVSGVVVRLLQDPDPLANCGLLFWVATIPAVEGMPFRRVVAELRVGALPEFLLNYLGLSLVGVAMALFYVRVGAWSVIIIAAPLVFARQMFFRSKLLEEASDELRDRERVLRDLS